MTKDNTTRRFHHFSFISDKMKRYPRHMWALVGFSALANLAILAPSFHMMQVYDRVLSSYSYGTLVSVTIAAIFVLVIYGIAETARLRLAQRLAAAFTQTYSKRIFIRSGARGDKANANEKLRDFQMARMFLSSKSLVSLFDFPFIPLFLILIFFVHPSLLFVTVIGMSAMIAAGIMSHNATRETKKQMKAADIDLAVFGQNVVGAVVPASSMGLLPNLLPLWETKVGASLKANEQASSKQSYLYAFAKVIRQIIQVTTMAWGAFLVINGDMSGGLIFLASMLSGKALAPIEQAIGALEQIEAGIEADARLRGKTDLENETSERSYLPAPSGDLQLHNLTALDNRNRHILTGINGTIRRGQCLVIEGASGSGKTTLLALIAGVREPQGGAISLDRIDQTKWPIRQWGEIVGYCPERGGLHSGTVMANVSRFTENPQSETVYSIMIQLGMHAPIMDLPSQYDTVIDDNTPFLSAAQLRLLMIARAVYTSPSVLIIDRPEVYLDVKTQALVANLLKEMKARGTTILLCSESEHFRALADRRIEISGSALREISSTNKDVRSQIDTVEKAFNPSERVPA